MSQVELSQPSPPSPPLGEESRRRGRRLAIASHPLGMTFSMVFTQHLPTLALVALGASETVVGLQSAFGIADLLRLPALRAVSIFSKRAILIAGQATALVTALPMLAFPWLLEASRAGSTYAVSIALLSLMGVVAGMKFSDTVWFPLLRSYVEPEAIGRFFGTLRSGWHFALILYYVGASLWLLEDPMGFGPLFAVAWGLGVLRIPLIRRLPERNERTGERIRARDAIALIVHNPRLRRYLTGVGTAAAVRGSVVPFALVMMRREIGFSDGEILYTTAASFAGGLAALYLSGRLVDFFGPAPLFRVTAVGNALLIASLSGVEQASPLALFGLVGFFFTFSALNAGFGVADTHVLFGLTPPEAPARTLVIALTVSAVLGSTAPLLAGFALERGLSHSGTNGLVVYHGFFLIAAAVQACVFWPLRGFREQEPTAEPVRAKREMPWRPREK
ncbi:hypothetical protein MK280_13095 [Myxococcota bacterium]|nr:hypothetical protein [Myxococcota bacterium]